jgi:hypothetical protein
VVEVDKEFGRLEIVAVVAVGGVVQWRVGLKLLIVCLRSRN